METPKFTVEWESRWQEFWTSVPVALGRAAPGTPRDYVRTGIKFRAPAACIAGELALALGLLSLAPSFLRPAQRDTVMLKSGFENYTVYYVPQDLPNVSDVNGSEQGHEGKSGGAHMYQPRQVIRVARGRVPEPAVADAPTLRLPVSKERASNLLAVLGSVQATRVLPAAPEVSGLRNRAHRAPTAEVVAPAPEIADLRHRNTAQPPTVAVVPPPPDVTAMRQKNEPLPAALVLPPPPTVTGLRPQVGAVPPTDVVPPPPSVTAQRGKAPANLGTIAIAGPVDRAGTGVGGTGASMGAGRNSAVIVSADAGSTLGIPEGAVPGVTTMSPTGGSSPGAGGHGGSTGTGIGNGTGRGTTGSGVGSGGSGNGYGADPHAHGGISASAGPGGADLGKAPRAAAGVVISGGIVDIPSFGSSSGPSSPRHLPLEKNTPPAVVIIATSRSGGGLPEYGVLRGNRVYTTYLNTPRGNVVLQFADPESAGNDFDLTPPQLLNSGLPADNKLPRTVVSCVLEPTGAVKNIHVLDSSTPDVAAAVTSYLRSWRFRPALRGDKAVAVQAILAFGITTQ